MLAAQAQDIVELTVNTIKGIRTDEAFELFFQVVEHLRSLTETEEPTLPRKRKAPKRLEVGDGDPHHSSTIQEHYREPGKVEPSHVAQHLQGETGWS